MKEKEAIINNYITGYNDFDVNKTVSDFDEEIVFENISNGATNMSVKGLEAFREQAEQSKAYFSQRTQTITSFKHKDDETQVEIDYKAILAIDFPNGLKRGDELKLKGTSVFKFSGSKIIRLTDIS